MIYKKVLVRLRKDASPYFAGVFEGKMRTDPNGRGTVTINVAARISSGHKNYGNDFREYEFNQVEILGEVA